MKSNSRRAETPRQTYDISAFELNALRKCVKWKSEIDQIIAECTAKSFAQDRLRALAVLQMMRTLLHNLKCLRRQIALYRIEIPWVQLSAVREVLHRISKTLDDGGLPLIWRIAHDDLPLITLPIEQFLGELDDNAVSLCLPKRKTLATDHSFLSTYEKLGWNENPESSDWERFFEAQIRNHNKFHRYSIRGDFSATDPFFEMFRAQVAVWFSHLPLREHLEFESRFSGTDEIQYMATFYELYFH